MDFMTIKQASEKWGTAPDRADCFADHFIIQRSAPLSADWKKRIDEDYKKRGDRKHK